MFNFKIVKSKKQATNKTTIILSQKAYHIYKKENHITFSISIYCDKYDDKKQTIFYQKTNHILYKLKMKIGCSLLLSQM